MIAESPIEYNLFKMTKDYDQTTHLDNELLLICWNDTF